MVSPWHRKQGEASLQPARLPFNTNTGSAGESRVPSLSLGTERFIPGFFISARCWRYADAACSPPPQWQGNYAPGPAARMPRIYAFQGLLLTWQHMALSSEHLLHLRLLLLPLLLLLLFLLLPRMPGLDRGSPWLPVPFMLDLFILGETSPLGGVGR